MLPLQTGKTGLFVPIETGNGRNLSELRQTIARMQTPAVALDAPGDCAFGVAELDRALGGGLAYGALHEIAAYGEAHVAAATGFALGMAALPSLPTLPLQGRVKKSVVWIAEDMALIESGAPYGPGLDLFGLAPERLLTVAAAKADDVFWAMEEALHCRAVDVVIGEVRNTARELDLVATRRLSFAAAAHGALALLLRTAPGTGASAAATRWMVGAASSYPSPERGGSNDRRSFGVGTSFALRPAPDGLRCATAVDLPLSEGSKGPHGIGPPRFDLALTRNRRGPLGSWMLEWSAIDASFVLATHPEPVARTSFDRSDTRAA